MRQKFIIISGITLLLILVWSYFWIDALFTLATDKAQRAFELLSKTRVVRVQREEAR